MAKNGEFYENKMHKIIFGWICQILISLKFLAIQYNFSLYQQLVDGVWSYQ